MMEIIRSKTMMGFLILVLGVIFLATPSVKKIENQNIQNNTNEITMNIE